MKLLLVCVIVISIILISLYGRRLLNQAKSQRNAIGTIEDEIFVILNRQTDYINQSIYKNQIKVNITTAIGLINRFLVENIGNPDIKRVQYIDYSIFPLSGLIHEISLIHYYDAEPLDRTIKKVIKYCNKRQDGQYSIQELLTTICSLYPTELLITRHQTDIR